MSFYIKLLTCPCRPPIVPSEPEPTTTSLVARATLLISQPATHQTIVTFLTCGVIQAFVWAVVTEVSKPEARLGIFASTT